MKRFLPSVLVAAAALFLVDGTLSGGAGAPPSFPGAEGFGADTPGGRGGAVLFVDNLNDAGPGSLRAACDFRGPRTVLFRVAGVLDLKSPIRITEPFITIAGQSAPGDGVCLRGHGLAVDAHDVVIRYLRSRPGDVSGEEVDGLGIGGTSRRVVIDHCSVSWAVDENLSPSGNIADVTVQWCLIAESLNRSVHRKGPHGYGSLVRASGGLTMHHNLWAHNHGRNPRLGDNYGRPPFPLFDIRNNVIHNAGSASIAGDRFEANYVANLIRIGPDADLSGGIISPTEGSSLQFYLDGNMVEGRPEWTAQPLRLFTRLERDGRRLVNRVDKPFPVPPVRTSAASELLNTVLEGAGASRPARDSVDERVVASVREGKGSIIDSQNAVGGWPQYRVGKTPADSDGDGIPDDWEKARGLDPGNRTDAVADRDGDGYTNLEEYLDSLSRPGR